MTSVSLSDLPTLDAGSNATLFVLKLIGEDPSPSGYREAVVIPVISRLTGVLLAVPVDFLPPGLLTQGAAAGVSDVVGPSQLIQVPAIVEDLTTQEEIPAGSMMDVLLVDFSQEVVQFPHSFDVMADHSETQFFSPLTRHTSGYPNPKETGSSTTLPRKWCRRLQLLQKLLPRSVSSRKPRRPRMLPWPTNSRASPRFSLRCQSSWTTARSYGSWQCRAEEGPCVSAAFPSKSWNSCSERLAVKVHATDWIPSSWKNSGDIASARRSCNSDSWRGASTAPLGGGLSGTAPSWPCPSDVGSLDAAEPSFDYPNSSSGKPRWTYGLLFRFRQFFNFLVSQRVSKARSSSSRLCQPQRKIFC